MQIGVGAFQCLRHNTSSLVKPAWFYFPLFAGICFGNGQSQFSTSDSICTPEQERNSFWEPPRNLRIPQQACGNWWLSCTLGCSCHCCSLDVGAVSHSHTQRQEKSASLCLCVCPIKPMHGEHPWDHLFHLFWWKNIPLCVFTSDFPGHYPFWMYLVASILPPPLVHW